MRTHGDLVRFRSRGSATTSSRTSTPCRVVVENAKGTEGRNYEGLRVLLGDGLL